MTDPVWNQNQGWSSSLEPGCDVHALRIRIRVVMWRETVNRDGESILWMTEAEQTLNHNTKDHNPPLLLERNPLCNPPTIPVINWFPVKRVRRGVMWSSEACLPQQGANEGEIDCEERGRSFSHHFIHNSTAFTRCRHGNEWSRDRDFISNISVNPVFRAATPPKVCGQLSLLATEKMVELCTVTWLPGRCGAQWCNTHLLQLVRSIMNHWSCSIQ